jgi:hypothetical protein
VPEKHGLCEKKWPVKAAGDYLTKFQDSHLAILLAFYETNVIIFL